MMKFLLTFLINRLQPSDMISLGQALQAAGQAAVAKQAAISAALDHIRTGVTKLTQ